MMGGMKCAELEPEPDGAVRRFLVTGVGSLTEAAHCAGIPQLHKPLYDDPRLQHVVVFNLTAKPIGLKRYEVTVVGDIVNSSADRSA